MVYRHSRVLVDSRLLELQDARWLHRLRCARPRLQRWRKIVLRSSCSNEAMILLPIIRARQRVLLTVPCLPRQR